MICSRSVSFSGIRAVLFTSLSWGAYFSETDYTLASLTVHLVWLHMIFFQEYFDVFDYYYYYYFFCFFLLLLSLL